MLQHALEYAREGIAVFPCKRDKSPANANGFHGATTDEATIVRWWTETPDALIGGAVPEGRVIIDVDPRNGGTDTLKKYAADGKRLALTRKARTGSGGTHWWYTTDVPSERLRSTLGDGVDVKRAGKGYVILPPSESDAGEYKWLTEGDVPLPAWVLEVVLKPEQAKREAPVDPTKRPPWMPTTGYAEKALKEELLELELARPGERNDALNRAAFSLFQLVYGGEIDEELVASSLYDAAARLGLSDHEIAGTMSSAANAAALDPRTAPPKETPAAAIARQRTPDRREDTPEVAPEASYWMNWQVETPPPPFYLYPLLPKNAYVIVYGATEASKSMVWTGILARGSRHAEQIKSSVYSLENPAHVDRRRLNRFNPDPANFRLTNEPLDLADWGQVEDLIKREHAWDTDVILLDTYSHAFASRSDDGNAKAIEFARVVRHIMHEVGCTVVVVDHTGYENRTEPRDASAKRQQVDVAIFMEREGGWEGPGSKARFSMTNNKSARFGNPFDNLRGAIVDTHGGGLDIEWADSEINEWWTK